MRKLILLIALIGTITLGFELFTKPPKADSGVIRGRPETMVSNVGNTESVTITQVSATFSGSPSISANAWEGSQVLSAGESKEFELGLVEGEASGSYEASVSIHYTENGSSYVNTNTITMEVE